MSERGSSKDAGALAPQAVRLVAPHSPEAPVVFDSPHSGGIYPPDFRPAIARADLRRSEDRFVDVLVADAPDHGATLICAEFARAYIDPNRRADDIDPAMIAGGWPDGADPSRQSELGVGLIFRVAGNGVPIYDRMLTAGEVHQRIARYWRPYHALLARTLDDVRSRYGAVWHVNWHSMLGKGDALSPDPGVERPDFVLGDLDGRSCAPEFTRFVAARLEAMGRSVAVNDPYRGAFIVDRHGRPQQGCHSLQIEINRDLYMSQRDLAPHEGFTRLRAELASLAAAICAFARQSAP